jgi:hypothetical protein
MHHPNYKSIKAAYAFYNVGSNDASLQDIMQDVLIVAKNVINDYTVYVIISLHLH